MERVRSSSTEVLTEQADGLTAEAASVGAPNCLVR